MIAALMASTDGSADRAGPTYLDLARVQARLTRSVPATACNRLARECISLQPLRIDVRFSVDEERVKATGEIHGSCELACQRCLEPRTWEIRDSFELLLAHDDNQAQRWASTPETMQIPDVVVVNGAELDLVELIEDEVILHLPSQVCVDAECENRPRLTYGGEHGSTGQGVPHPFAALDKLKKRD